MKHLVSVIDDNADACHASPAEIAAIDAFNDRLRAQGQLVFAGGLERLIRPQSEYVGALGLRFERTAAQLRSSLLARMKN